jgi:hypothetical protein
VAAIHCGGMFTVRATGRLFARQQGGAEQRNNIEVGNYRVTELVCIVEVAIAVEIDSDRRDVTDGKTNAYASV